MEPFLPSLEQIRRIQSTVWTVLLFLVCNGGSMFRQQRRRNSFGLRLNMSKQCFEVVMRFRLCSNVSKRGTHLADSFLMPNVSCRTFCMRSVEIYTMLVISLIFTRRSANTISWILLTISSVVTSIGRPGRFSSKMDVRPRLNSLNQNLMVVIEGASSLYTACNFILISSHVFPSKNRNRITDRYCSFSMIATSTNSFTFNCYKN